MTIFFFGFKMTTEPASEPNTSLLDSSTSDVIVGGTWGWLVQSGPSDLPPTLIALNSPTVTCGREGNILIDKSLICESEKSESKWRHVSRVHFTLKKARRGATLIDSSSNGTWINEVRGREEREREIYFKSGHEYTFLIIFLVVFFR